jgi:3''(2''),5''-bisphosphate nucleotidase (EC 3.1.3.7)
MPVTDDRQLLDALQQIAHEAGEKILAVYHSDFAVQQKGDDSPLTEADLAAHHHIKAALAALTPDIPLLSEEGAQIPFAERRTWERFWLVDPLDGTRDFVKRNGEFTVNIALIERHRPRLAVIHVPVSGVGYAAARDLGAFRRESGQTRAIRCRKTAQPPTFVVSKSHRTPDLDVFLAHAPAHEAVSRGSSLKFCLVAEGSADLYPRTGPTSEWDTAAGQCIAECAGRRSADAAGLAADALQPQGIPAQPGLHRHRRSSPRLARHPRPRLRLSRVRAGRNG